MSRGPCSICGATGYALSIGGPSICPACDCGVPVGRTAPPFPFPPTWRDNALRQCATCGAILNDAPFHVCTNASRTTSGAEVESAQQGQPASAVAVQPGERVPCSRCTSDVYCEMNGCQRPATAPVQAHSKSEYKRRVAMGDENVKPPVQASVAPSDDARAAFLRDDAPPTCRCNVCGRKSWDVTEPGHACAMPQPHGAACGGTMAATGNAAAAPLPPPSAPQPVVTFNIVDCGGGMRRLDCNDSEWWSTLATGAHALYTRPASASAPAGVRGAMEKAVYELEHQQPSGYVTRAVEALNAALASLTEAAPAEQRMPLSDEKILRVFFDVYGEDNTTHAVPWKFARTIEAAHGIQEAKNAVGGQQPDGAKHG